MPRILVTGAAGMLGAASVDYFHSKGWEIHALARNNQVGSPEKCASIHYDKIEDGEKLTTIVQSLPPLDMVLHGAALTNLERCEADFKAAINVNTIGTLNLVNALKNSRDRAGMPLVVYISSDAVYPDIEGRKSENTPVAPASNYGISKLWGETVALREWDKSLVLRTTIVGDAKHQFAGWVLATARAGGHMKLFTDVLFSPLFVGDLCRLIETAYDRRLTGLFNAGSADSISKADFALKLLERAGLSPSFELTSLMGQQLVTPRSLNMALDSTAFYKALEASPFSANDAINHLEIRS